MDAEVFKDLLLQSQYPLDKTNFIYQGFTQGFSLGYKGPTKVKNFAPNLKIRVGSPVILWKRVMKEVRLKRFAGPYKQVSFEFFI